MRHAAYSLFALSIIASMLFAFSSMSGAEQAKTYTYVNNAKRFRGPLSYKDPRTNFVYYVETDGRHVTAIKNTGDILWTRNPFVDAKLEPYRVGNPQIVFIGAPLEWMTKKRDGNYIAINFNSSQFGIINTESGDFTFLGQD